MIAKQASCTMHRENTMNKKKAVMPSTASTLNSLLALNQHVVKKLDFLFKNAKDLAKNGKPLKDFEYGS